LTLWLDGGRGEHGVRPECPSNIIAGVRGPDPSSRLVEAIQYVSSAPLAGYASNRYSAIVFSRSGCGVGFMSDLPNVIEPNPTTGNGIGVNWNFGSTAGTSNTEVRLVYSENLLVNYPTTRRDEPARG